MSQARNLATRNTLIALTVVLTALSLNSCGRQSAEPPGLGSTEFWTTGAGVVNTSGASASSAVPAAASASTTSASATTAASANAPVTSTAVAPAAEPVTKPVSPSVSSPATSPVESPVASPSDGNSAAAGDQPTAAPSQSTAASTPAASPTAPGESPVSSKAPAAPAGLTASGEIAGIKVNFAQSKATISTTFPAKVGQESAKMLNPGSGTVLAPDQNVFLFTAVFNLNTGKQVQNNFGTDTPPIPFNSDYLTPIIFNAVKGSKNGSIGTYVLPADESSPDDVLVVFQLIAE